MNFYSRRFAEALQQLCVVDADRPVGEERICGLVALPSLEQSRELLYFVPGAHMLEGKTEEMLVGDVTQHERKKDIHFFTFVTLKSS